MSYLTVGTTALLSTRWRNAHSQAYQLKIFKYLSRGFCPPFLGGCAFLHPPFFEFWARGNCTQTPQSRPDTTVPSWNQKISKVWNIRKCRSTVKGNGKSKGTAIPIKAWAGREGCTGLRLPEFVDRRNMKVVKLSASLTSCLYPPGNTSGTHFC